MAIGADTAWRIRVSGDNDNGGGYDSTISGAGTDYTDQDSAQLTLTDLATSGAGVTTLTSSTGGFTSAMIGNCIKITSGTNFDTGYYFVTAHTDTNTVTLDRSPSASGAGSGGNGKLGGAFALLEPLATTGANGLSTPSVSTPLAAGHTIYIRGAGSDDPTTVDYDYQGSSTNGYYVFPSGSTGTGRIRVVGYNGRPLMQYSGLLIYNCQWWSIENLKFKAVASATYTAFGVFAAGSYRTNSARDCKFDVNGNDMQAIQANVVFDCQITNSGSTTAGTKPVINIVQFGEASGNTITDVRGDGISAVEMGCISRNTIDSCGGDAIALISTQTFLGTVTHNTIYNAGGDGISVEGSEPAAKLVVHSNLITDCGAFGIDIDGTSALNDRRVIYCDYNAFYNNTSGEVDGLTAPANDVTLTADPFTNAGGGDFSLNSTAGGGTACKAAAFGSNLDLGANQSAAGGGGGFRRITLNGGMNG